MVCIADWALTSGEVVYCVYRRTVKASQAGLSLSTLTTMVLKRCETPAPVFGRMSLGYTKVELGPVSGSSGIEVVGSWLKFWSIKLVSLG